MIRGLCKFLLAIFPDKPKFLKDQYCSRCFKQTCWAVEGNKECSVCGPGYVSDKVSVLYYRLGLAEQVCRDIADISTLPVSMERWKEFTKTPWLVDSELQWVASAAARKVMGMDEDCPGFDGYTNHFMGETHWTRSLVRTQIIS